MKALMRIMVVGAIGTLLVEVMVLGLGVRVGSTLALLSLFNVLLAVGIWGLHRAAAPAGAAAKLAMIGAAFTTIGLLILAVPPWPVARSWDLELGQVVRDSTLYSAGLIAASVGMVLFGIAHFGNTRFYRWTAVTLIVCPPIAMLVMLNDGPLLVGNLAGLGVGLALTAMALTAVLPSNHPQVSNQESAAGAA